MYVNPVPMIDAGKDFTMELEIHFDDITEVDHAKEILAEYILNLPKEKLANLLRCKQIKPVYHERVIKNA